MNTNEIFKGIITRIETILDKAGNPEHKLIAKVYSEAEFAGVGGEFEVRPLSSIPTKPLGTKGVALPSEGQRLLLFRSPTSDIAYIIGYVEETSASITAYERPLEEGEQKISTQGMRTTEVSIKPNEISLDSGGYSNMYISQRTSSINMQSKKYLRLFHGGHEENQWIKKSGITPTTANWSKYKESNAASDKFNIETEEPRTPILGVLPDYVDKVVERKGAILDYSNGGELLDHVYQLETRQDVGQTGTKNTFSVLRLGNQVKMAGSLPDRQGFIIDWSTKKVNPTNNATVTQNLAGISPNGEIARRQYVDGVVISPTPGIDPAAKDKGYELLDITSDNSSTITNFWQSESINTGADGYFYRKGHGKTNFLHNYEESSENSFIKRQSSRKDGTTNEFLEEIKQDSYEMTLQTDNTTYSVVMSSNSIKIQMNPDDNNKNSYIELNDSKAEVKFGADSVVTLSDEICDIKTSKNINLDTKDANITASGNINIEGNNITTKGKIDFTGGAATMNGPVAPTGDGALCGIKMCLFNGAPHAGSTAINP